LRIFNEVNSKVGSNKKHKSISKEADEVNTIAEVSGRKCRLYHKIGHYASKCPNKENKET
jgi:hypothetical protein